MIDHLTHCGNASKNAAAAIIKSVISGYQFEIKPIPVLLLLLSSPITIYKVLLWLNQSSLLLQHLDGHDIQIVKYLAIGHVCAEEDQTTTIVNTQRYRCHSRRLSVFVGKLMI